MLLLSNTRAGIDMLKEEENVLIDFRVVGLRDILAHQSANGTTRNVTQTVSYIARYDTHHPLPGRNLLRSRPIEADDCMHKPVRT